MLQMANSIIRSDQGRSKTLFGFFFGGGGCKDAKVFLNYFLRYLKAFFFNLVWVFSCLHSSSRCKIIKIRKNRFYCSNNRIWG